MNRLMILSAVVLAGCSGGDARSDEDVAASVEAVLTAQRDAWNAGDLNGYLAPIADLDSARHIIGGQIIRGYDDIAAGYRIRNGDVARGEIDFSGLEVTPLGDDAALALADFSFEMGDVRRSGVFTLVLRRIDGEWQIVHDHTTLGGES